MAQHDNAAFSSLVEMHQGKIRAFLVRLCKSYDLADDLAQETFISAYRRLSTFEGKGSFQGWLFRIAYNCFMQHIRSSKRREEVTDEFSTQYQVLEIQEDRYDTLTVQQIDLENAMQQLSDQENASISLCHSYGHSHQEVADILQLPLGTVKSSILRGKEKLRAILTPKREMEKAS